MKVADVRYESTRGGCVTDFPGTLMKGIAENGGLFVPSEWPKFTEGELERLLRVQSYTQMAYLVLRKFVDRETARHLRGMIARAYTKEKFGKGIVPVQQIGERLFLLKPSEGPTWAFKDIALQILAEMIDFWLEKTDAYLNIVVATSGDTGAATIEAFRGRKRIHVFVLSPTQGNMSGLQKAMMYGVKDRRVHNIVVDGNFDDAQAVVKEIFADKAFKESFHLGSANSINWLRVIAQSVYFVWAWSRIAGSTRDPVSFSVPTGNFGDAYACFVPKMMGVPIGRIIVATNENDILERFFRIGRYDCRRGEKIIETFSPSMNIKVASNFERLLFEAFDRDGPAVERLMSRMKEGGEGWFDIADTPEFAYFRRMGFVSGSCSDAGTLDAILEAKQVHKVLLDPHTAVAYDVGLDLVWEGETMAIVETARWQKFPDTIRRALGKKQPLPRAYHGLMRRRLISHPMEADAIAVRKFIADHSNGAA